MTVSLLLSLIGIGLVDSLNPSLFVAQFYLLTTPRPAVRIISYITGILTVNFLAGVLILSGVRTLLADVLTAMNLNVLYGVQLAIGLAILVFGLWMRIATAQPEEAQKPRSLHPWHTFVLGMVVMVNEITTALPYFVAIEQIAQAALTTPQNLLALVIYNLVFSLPLFGFLLLALTFRERFARQLEGINQWIAHWVPRVIKYGSVVFGGVLSVDAAIFLLTGTAFFT